jgi:hypothetical protein
MKFLHDDLLKSPSEYTDTYSFLSVFNIETASGYASGFEQAEMMPTSLVGINQQET